MLLVLLMGGGDTGVPLVVDKLERVVLDETLGQVLAHDVHELADDERHRALAYHFQIAPILERILRALLFHHHVARNCCCCFVVFAFRVCICRRRQRDRVRVLLGRGELVRVRAAVCAPQRLALDCQHLLLFGHGH